MTKHRPALAAAIGSLTLAGAVVTGASQAVAVGEACHGRPATVLSTPYNPVVGTEGDDVIVVTSGSGQVSGLGGNDVICLLPGDYSGNTFSIDAGAGDDLVDTSAMGASRNSTQYIDITLGAGRDRLLGGPADESVSADAPGSAEDDVISTGGTNRTGDGDGVASGTPGLPNGDTIDLGPGPDRVVLSGTQLTGSVDGGEGETEVSVGDPAGSYEIDVAAGSVRRDGVAWTPILGTLSFAVTDYAGLVFHGTDGPDELTLTAGTGTGTRSVALRGGDDSVHLERAPREGDVLDGGAGSDKITFFSPGTTIDLDLGSGVLDLAHATGDAFSLRTPGFEHATVAGKDVTVRGTGEGNSIYVVGCRVRAEGGAGRDGLMHGKDYYYEENDLYNCDDASARLDGGSGNDRLWGNDGDDLLRGGAGNDRIEGRAGDDRIWGGAGRDVLRGDDHARGKKHSHDRIWGGTGDDVLHGLKGNDRLRGGGGRDVAKGGDGRDLCRAEKRRTCER